jgi:hypothetical protein
MTLLSRTITVAALSLSTWGFAQTTPALSPNPAASQALTGTGQVENADFNPVQIYICGSTQKISPGPAPDCSPGAKGVSYALPLANGAQFVQTDSTGNFQVTLKNPLAVNNYVWLVQLTTSTAPGSKPVPKTTGPEQVLPASAPPFVTYISRPDKGLVDVTGTGQPTSPDGYTANIYVCVLPAGTGQALMASAGSPDCSPTGTYKTFATAPLTTGPDGSFNEKVSLPKGSGDYIAVTQVATLVNGVANPSQSTTVRQPTYDGVCQYSFNDCDYIWTLLGGIEQADLSAQSSQTEGFVDLFVRAPWNSRLLNAWLHSRFLGAPASTNTLNVVTAATSASGFTTQQLPQTVLAVDYTLGYEHDFLLPSARNPGSGQFTLGPIVSIGGTTPLDASSASLAYKVPDYGTNECAQLQQRFGSAQITNTSGDTPVTIKGPNPNGYAPPLPPPGYYTTSTQSTSTTPGCVVQPPPGHSVAGNSTANPPGTQITTIAFSNQDRTSFLMKWEAGARFINRWHTGTSTYCSSWSSATQGHANDGPCVRMIVDSTIGQDQDITAGYLRHFVFKNNIVVPLGKKGLYFFGSAQNRFEHNKNYSPLILSSVPIATGANPPAGSITIPSDSVFVLPLKQPDRDYYRIGFGIDVTTLMKAWF